MDKFHKDIASSYSIKHLDKFSQLGVTSMELEGIHILMEKIPCCMQLFHMMYQEILKHAYQNTPVDRIQAVSSRKRKERSLFLIYFFPPVMGIQIY